ncbi:PREDICTED: uncharacterized protein LOC104809714 [Tarenaya hassleriana]|uniref:uncharacterized protein LOC104809714 n=1 Tax=Tarenaya hassleriana TaxID=28532 RepID=UPI00053C1BAD|nr:PREDICTED: uncharacterized protein LOC104809714 [Tarenaya hassleriana]
MVSVQEGTLWSRKRGIPVYREELHSSFKKRKQEDGSQGKLESTLLNKGTDSGSTSSITFDVELHLRTPLPLDWQERLDAKDQSRASEDRSRYPEEPAGSRGQKMSLDLELNLLPSDSPGQKIKQKIYQSSIQDKAKSSTGETFTSSNKKNGVGQIGLSRCPSWLSFEGEEDEDEKKKKRELVATVCKKCHMLVMLCKSAPVCPNCKFMHPPHDHDSMDLFKPSSSLLSLLC